MAKDSETGLMKWLDAYAIFGVAVPGAALLFGASLFVPELQQLFASKDMGLGNLGLFLVIAYVSGQLLQAGGNLLEWLWWLPWGGMPTDWIRTEKGRWGWVRWLGIKTLIAGAQVEEVGKQIPLKLGVPAVDITTLDRRSWYGITRQMWAAVAAQGRADRIEKFNTTYGLNRGMATALLGLAVAMLVQSEALWPWSVAVAAMAALFLARMHRFGKTYARELLVQFLQIAATPPSAQRPASADG